MSIQQSISIKTSPDKLYRALTVASEFSSATGAPAEIGPDEGDAFSCFGGQITGRLIELLPGKRIVQAWRAGPWPEGIYSIVRFEFSPSNLETTVTLTHSGYPEGADEHLSKGWKNMYWDPLSKYLE